MLKFQVEDMTCGHCASTITNAVREVDGKASIAIDLPTHQVRVESAADVRKIEEAIRDAGYTPVAVD